MLQKKAIRIINHSDYLSPTNPLFSKSKILKFEDQVDLNTAVFMFKVHKHVLPPCMQDLFEERESPYPLRGTCIFNKGSAKTNIKGRCISVKGVNLWNKLDDELKMCTTITKFKSSFKCKALNKYRTLDNA